MAIPSRSRGFGLFQAVFSRLQNPARKGSIPGASTTICLVFGSISISKSPLAPCWHVFRCRDVPERLENLDGDLPATLAKQLHTPRAATIPCRWLRRWERRALGWRPVTVRTDPKLPPHGRGAVASVPMAAAAGAETPSLKRRVSIPFGFTGSALERGDRCLAVPARWRRPAAC
jgi:hypothetical protein